MKKQNLAPWLVPDMKLHAYHIMNLEMVILNISLHMAVASSQAIKQTAPHPLTTNDLFSHG